MKLFKLRPVVYATLVIIFAVNSLTAETSDNNLTQGFQNPPLAARPRVWWHWMNGNIAKEGIKLDLEWMQRVH